MADQAKKLGVYICTGCGIGDAVDAEALAKVASGDGGAALCRTHGDLCSDEGLALIRQDISGEGVDAVVVAACSSRAKQDAFDGLEGAVVARASLREGVTWILEGGDEDTQWLAEDYVRMACARAKAMKAPEPFEEGSFSKAILVIGGGVAGMTAAFEAAKAGYEVHLVEKESALGGFSSKLHKSVPSGPPYDQLEEVGTSALVDAVTSHPKVAVHTASEVTKIEGGPCKFAVSLSEAGDARAIEAGAIVVATGFEPYDPTQLGHLGFGRFDDVVTSVTFEEMAAAGELRRPSNGAPVRNVLFIQCAGSRDPEHLPYCSTVCCTTTLKQSLYLKEQDPASQAFILYKDLRSPGQREDLYRRVQREGGVFIRGELKELGQKGAAIEATVDDLLLGEDVTLQDLDLVVLATGMVPTTRMEGERIEPLAGDDLKQSSILHLEYRQGPELPNLRYGYPDSHFICFPYETRRTGIYAAGAVRRAMDMAAAKRDAVGAALKAIQCVEVTARGEAVHPRAGDRSYPEFNMSRCTQCKRCTEECPFGAINEDEKANPLPNPTRCRRCGTCMGACPERIISFKDYNIPMIGSMIKSIEVPDEDEEKPCVVAFVCENDALPVLDALALKRKQLSPYVRFIPLRCLGGVNQVWIADALSRGVDGVLFLGCAHGEDYQCHFIKGSELCSERLGKLQETLDRLSLESARARFEAITMNDEALVSATIAEFMETLEELGPNPFKGF